MPILKSHITNNAMLSMLSCNARLLATGGTCPDNSDALYANDFPKAYSKRQMIQHGVWITKKELIKEKAHAAQVEHHHFS